MDNDGDDDLLIQGEIEYIKSKTLFFKNDTGVYQSIPNNFKNTYQGTIQAVDIDNDGDQDIFMTNLGNLSKNLEASFFYINENGNFKERASNIPAYNLGTGHSCFVDLDNDGDKDLIIAGYRRKAPKLPEEYLEIVDIYLNTNGQFTLFKENAFPYLDQGSINAADVDGDGDQDILMTGYVGEITKTVLYINKLK